MSITSLVDVYLTSPAATTFSSIQKGRATSAHFCRRRMKPSPNVQNKHYLAVYDYDYFIMVVVIMIYDFFLIFLFAFLASPSSHCRRF